MDGLCGVEDECGRQQVPGSIVAVERTTYTRATVIRAPTQWTSAKFQDGVLPVSPTEADNEMDLVSGVPLAISDRSSSTPGYPLAVTGKLPAASGRSTDFQ